MDSIKIFLNDTGSLVTFCIILIITIIVATLCNKYLQKNLLQKFKDENRDVTSFIFIKHLVITIIYLIGLGWAFLSLPISVKFAHTIFASAGVSTLILGIAGQQVLGNLLCGFLLIFTKPFQINDVIEIQNNKGTVIELNLHDTILVDVDKNKIIIPNSLISNGIIKNFKRIEKE